MIRTSLITGMIILFSWFADCQSVPKEMRLQVPKYDLSSEPVLYTVGYAHLDTEWRWDYEETVNVFLRNTLDENFRMFEAYPAYNFTFSGARRYRMIRDYYPGRYDMLKQYIAAGRWHVGGSSVDECDVNIPSPESVIRQVLYGNQFFKKEFGKESVDFLLPDCFGFQAHLPSVLAHAGIKGFSTQKLSWGSANGIPFNIGRWRGPDGKEIVAALNATDYNGRVKPRLDTTAQWVSRVMNNGKKYGVFADYRYYGVGDVGGSPREEDIRNAVQSLGHPDGKIRIYLSSSDQLFRDLREDQAKQLPEYSGDLLLTEHSAGTLTSQAYMKRWNRKNEQLAASAEPVAVMADWLGGLPYPSATLNEAWWLVLGSQMHDILPGTSIPKAYEYAWNDEIVALNQFSSVLKSSAGAVIRAMDTRVKGRPLVVYNPLSIPRTDCVEAEIPYPEGTPSGVYLVDPSGDSIPFQVLNISGNSLRIVFEAILPSMGFACFDLQPARSMPVYRSGLSATDRMIDSELLHVTLNDSGDIDEIIDKRSGTAILRAPACLAFLHEHPSHWPAWNMDWQNRKNPPAGYVDGPATFTLLERGPVRATIRVERTARNSVFIQDISLSEGMDHVTVHNKVRWQSKGVSLKAVFPLTASAESATYNLGLGAAERTTNHEKKYEVPSREWFDLTDQSGKFGVTVFEDSKFGSDKPDDHTLRLTLLYTPLTNAFFDQASQDWGIHEFTYGLYGHAGDWRKGASWWQGRRLNQPLVAFMATPHEGFAGNSFSFASLSDARAEIRALKKAENGKDYIIRIQELTGQSIGEVTVTFPAKVIRAWEVDGQERMTGEATIRNGKLIVPLSGFAIRSFAFQLAQPERMLTEPVSYELPLIYDQDLVSSELDKTDGVFEQKGYAFPAEQLPASLTFNGIHFFTGPMADGKNNAMACRGQKIPLPKTGNYNHAYLLATAIHDTSGIFRIGNERTELRVQSYRGVIGQADLRTWDRYGRLTGLGKAFIKRDPVAWFTPHLHQDTSNCPYQYGYLYLYRLDASPASGIIQLPENPAIKIFAITVADDPFNHLTEVHPLYDDFSGREAMQPVIPHSHVKNNMVPVAILNVQTKRQLAEMPARPTMKDYADFHQPNGALCHYFFSNPDSSFLTGAASGNIRSGMAVTALNDGMFELMPSDSALDRWSLTGEGRIRIDLQKEIEIDSLHLFTTQDLRRGPQSFSVWAAGEGASPDMNGDPVSAGWKFLVLATPEEIWGNRIALYHLAPEKAKSLKYRYLMFLSEDSPHGPFFFREVDIFEKQN